MQQAPVTKRWMETTHTRWLGMVSDL